MTGTDITEWRTSRGWSLEEAAVQFGLPLSKLRAMERAKKLQASDERLAKLLIAGSAMLSLFGRVQQNHQAAQEAIMQDSI